MLFRSKKSPQRGTAAAPRGQECECRALVLIDVTDQKQALLEQIRLMQDRVQLNQARVERFHEVVVPAFGSWLDSEFQKEQQKARELAEQRQQLHRRLAMAQQIRQFAPYLKPAQVEEVIERALAQSIEPVLALHEWEKERLRNHPRVQAETPSMREKRKMQSIVENSEVLSDVLLARFQQQFEEQGGLHVDSVPPSWIQELTCDFLDYFKTDDGNPLLSLLFFLRQEQPRRRIEELVRDFIEQHFPKKKNDKRGQEERMHSFFEDLEEMFESLGGGFFGKRGRGEGDAPPGPAAAPSDDCKAVFRRLARQLHPDTGSGTASTAVWMEAQRLYRKGDLQGLMALEMDLAVKTGELPVDQLGLFHLLETRNALERTLKGQKSEWARLSRRPEAKLDRDGSSPSKLRALADKLRREFVSEIDQLEEELLQLQAHWIHLFKGRRSSKR
jgi:hypothetical protein